MATAAVPSRFPRFDAGKWAGMPGRFLESSGKIAWFTIQALKEIGHAVRNYPKEIIRLIA